MYMNLLGKPTDTDLDKYPQDPMSGIPQVWIIPTPPPLETLFWPLDPSDQDHHDPRIDEYGNSKWRVIQNLSILADRLWLSINMP